MQTEKYMIFKIHGGRGKPFHQHGLKLGLALVITDSEGGVFVVCIINMPNQQISGRSFLSLSTAEWMRTDRTTAVP